MMRRAYWSPSELAKYRNQKVSEIASYAFDNVPFYHELFRRLSIKPGDIKTVDDLKRIPLVRKTDIRKEIGKATSREFNVAHLMEKHTGGSTGRPFTVYLREEEDEYRKARHLRANMAVGHRPFDRWIILEPGSRNEPTSTLQRLSRFFNYTSVSLFEDIETQLTIIEKKRPDVLEGFSNTLYLLSREIKRKGVTNVKPKLVLGGGELTSDASRESIEKAFNAPFYDQYGSIEFERLAWQCKEKEGYHIDADSVVIQFVDQEGEEVATGERGEIVCTSLFNYAMPLIRYSLDDIGVASEEPTCTCGRTFPLMKVLEGRKNSLITMPDGRTITAAAFAISVDSSRFRDHIDQWRVIQKKPDLFDIQIKLADNHVQESLMKKSILENLQKSLGTKGDQLTFNINFVDQIPLEKTGKLRTVISEVEPIFTS